MKDKNNQNKQENKITASEWLLNLKPIDDEFMRCMFKDDIPFSQFVLRILTGKEDLTITELETQRDLKKLAGARSICLDAYGTDSLGKKYDIEVQRQESGANPYRARYHLSALDVENLRAGQNFNELPETFIIFVTEKDFFGKGKDIYKFDRIDTESGLLLNDGSHIIYVNGESRSDTDIGRLMHDFNCSDPNKMYFKEMADRAKYFKESKKGATQMSKMLEQMKAEWIDEGKIEGIREGKIECIRESNLNTAKKMIAAGNFTISQITEFSGLTKEEVEKLQQSLTNPEQIQL